MFLFLSSAPVGPISYGEKTFNLYLTSPNQTIENAVGLIVPCQQLWTQIDIEKNG